MKRVYFFILFLVACFHFTFYSHAQEQAIEIPVQILDSMGKDTSSLSEIDYNSEFILTPGESIHITSQYPIGSIYIAWNRPVTPWTLFTVDGAMTYGLNGFIHEYVPLEKTYQDIQIQATGEMAISYIRVFTQGTPPCDIQIWNTPNNKVDLLLVSAHADDELIHLGGTVPNSIALHGANVQVIYMSQFWDSEPYREHEKLDGLWTMGIRNYPECIGYGDYYVSKHLDEISELYDKNVMISYLVSQIRRFHPQIVVTHDFDGEYNHGLHKLTAECVALAVEASADPTRYPESCLTYGVWNTPKEYIHLLEQNPIVLDMHIPLPYYQGLDAMEIVRQAYDKHVSQHQYKRFYVGDDYKWSCAKFGLLRSTIGPDLTNDIFWNIIPYCAQSS